MNRKTMIYVAAFAAAIFTLGILGGGLWQDRKIERGEAAVEAARQLAEENERLAGSKEIEAAGYRQKAEYLERQLTEIQTIARRQDEELEKLNVNSGRARSDVEHARSTRTIAATADELCAKLAELGHGCR